jgi:hypothetical protein
LALGADASGWESFLGNETIGYKTGLNQRMLAIFVGALLGAVVWLAARGRLLLSWPFLLLLGFPLLADSITHAAAELNGLDGRTVNAWARVLFGGRPEIFFSGTSAGTLNWWLRTMTGLFFGGALTVYLLGRFDIYFRRLRRTLAPRVRRQPSRKE